MVLNCLCGEKTEWCFHRASTSPTAAYLIQGSAMQSITIRLTATIVENAKVGAKEYFLWDENTKGFGVRVPPRLFDPLTLPARNVV